MIRILAVSISAAALFAATLPANAQTRQGPDQQGHRVQGQQQFQGQRDFRSINPPAPGGQSAQVQPRSFNPPAPDIGTSQRSFGPQAPTGGQNFVGGPCGAPASLPAPSVGQSNDELTSTARPSSAITTSMFRITTASMATALNTATTSTAVTATAAGNFDYP